MRRAMSNDTKPEDVRIVPLRLLEMRQWAGEQRPDIRDRVLLLCDALEDAARVIYEAQLIVANAQRDVETIKKRLEGAL